MLPLPSPEELAATPWEDALTSASEPTCFAFSTVLFQKAREAEEKRNQPALGVYAFLGTVASFRRVEVNNESRLGPAVVAETWRSLGDGDLSGAQLDLLEGIVVNDPEMRARVCDLLWSRRRGHKFAVAAVEAYIASASRLETHDVGLDLVERIDRAIQLGFAVGGAPKDQAVAHLVSVLNRFRAQVERQIDFLGVKLLSLAYEVGAGEPASWAEHSEHYAETSERAGNWLIAREYWKLAAKFHARSKAESPGRAASIRAAETFVSEANTASTKSVGAQFLASAVEAYRRIGERERARELHATMLRWQQESVGEFKTVSESVDISDLVSQARSAVRGKSLVDALMALVQLTRFRRVTDLRKEVENSSQRYVHQTLFPAVVVDGNGKVIAQRAALRRGPAREDDDAVTCEMHSVAAFYRKISAQATIEPARAEIISEHAPAVQDLYRLVENHPFVPSGREVAYAKGLHSGLLGDFLTSTHILIPQLENSIRALLQRRAVITSTLLSDGTQEERDINSLLYEPAAKDIFGEDLLFCLRGILVHRFGANLRNNMAHGLLDDSAYFSPEAVYLWWVVLYIVCWPLLRVQNTVAPDGPSPSAGGDVVSE